MDKASSIYVAGHNGMVGSALVKYLKKERYNNIHTRDRSKLDLTDQGKTQEFFEEINPDYVVIAAAKVGGIMANINFKADFIYQNLAIQNNIISAAYKTKVQKLLFIGSACIYPKFSEQPIKENCLLSGSLEPTNEYYAVAKIAGIKLCQAFYEQYGCNFISAMPNNLYGPGDNFDLDTSHVLPALIRKMHEAKILNKKHIEVWGTGTPKREFLHVNDFADSILFLLKNLDADELYGNYISHINIGSGHEISIKNLALLIKKIIGFEGSIVFNHEKPDGMARKLLDISFMDKKKWNSQITLEEGIKSLYLWYLKQI